MLACEAFSPLFIFNISYLKTLMETTLSDIYALRVESLNINGKTKYCFLFSFHAKHEIIPKKTFKSKSKAKRIASNNNCPQN